MQQARRALGEPLAMYLEHNPIVRARGAIFEFARLCRVASVIRPYLDAIG